MKNFPIYTVLGNYIRVKCKGVLVMFLPFSRVLMILRESGCFGCSGHGRSLLFSQMGGRQMAEWISSSIVANCWFLHQLHHHYYGTVDNPTWQNTLVFVLIHCCIWYFVTFGWVTEWMTKALLLKQGCCSWVSFGGIVFHQTGISIHMIGIWFCWPLGHECPNVAREWMSKCGTWMSVPEYPNVVHECPNVARECPSMVLGMSKVVCECPVVVLECPNVVLQWMSMQYW